MKKFTYLYLLLILLSSCEEHEFKVLEESSWQITDYRINGADSMSTITAFKLEGRFYFGERGGSASTPTLLVYTSVQGPTSGYLGTWWVDGDTDILEMYINYGSFHVNKFSFKPFRSQWTITKLTKKDMQLELTLDNRKHYLRFKPYKL